MQADRPGKSPEKFGMQFMPNMDQEPVFDYNPIFDEPEVAGGITRLRELAELDDTHKKALSEFSWMTKANAEVMILTTGLIAQGDPTKLTRGEAETLDNRKLQTYARLDAQRILLDASQRIIEDASKNDQVYAQASEQIRNVYSKIFDLAKSKLNPDDINPIREAYLSMEIIRRASPPQPKP